MWHGTHGSMAGFHLSWCGFHFRWLGFIFGGVGGWASSFLGSMVVVFVGWWRLRWIDDRCGFRFVVILLFWFGFDLLLICGFCLVLISMILLDWCGFDFAGCRWSVMGLIWFQLWWYYWIDVGSILLGFIGHLWVLFWQWWVMGSEAGVVCLSFGSLFGFVHGGGGGNR